MWFATVWPRALTSATSSGKRSASTPIMKCVARAPWRSKRSSSAGVTAGFGPSSKVSATALRSVRTPTTDPATGRKSLLRTRESNDLAITTPKRDIGTSH